MTTETPTGKPVLWLGAHKTGTTFLQKALDRSQDALVRHGWRYMDLDAFRAAYTRPLLYGNLAQAPQPADPGLNLFFDENIPNLVQHALNREGLYPALVERSLKLATHFGLTDPDLWFGIRDYAGFVPSLYCEALKSTPYRGFDDFYRRDLHRLDWNDVIDRLREAFPRSQLFVYHYEELRGNEARLLSRVTAIPDDEFTLPRTISRPGFSQAAIDALAALSGDRAITPEDVLAATRIHPKTDKTPSFQPFDEAERIELSRKYREDAARLAAREDVTMIDLA